MTEGIAAGGPNGTEGVVSEPVAESVLFPATGKLATDGLGPPRIAVTCPTLCHNCGNIRNAHGTASCSIKGEFLMKILDGNLRTLSSTSCREIMTQVLHALLGVGVGTGEAQESPLLHHVPFNVLSKMQLWQAHTSSC